MALLDTGTPGTSREIYSEDADGETLLLACTLPQVQLVSFIQVDSFFKCRMRPGLTKLLDFV